MYCHSCGQLIDEQCQFCKACGVPVMIEPVVSQVGAGEEDQSNVHSSLKMPSWYLMLRSNRLIIAGAIVVGVLLIAYFIARISNGPSTPEALHDQFSRALMKRDIATVAKLLDSDDKQLQDAKSLALFQDSLTGDVVKAYIQALDSETQKGSDISGHNWLRLVSTSSWRGTSWRVHLVPINVKVKDVTGDTVGFSIGGMASNKGRIQALWPSVYDVKGKVSNDFTSEDIATKADILKKVSSVGDYGPYDYQLDLAPQIKNKIVFDVPQNVSNFQVLLNDKPVANTGNEVTVSPGPTSGTIEVKGNVMGVSIDEKGSLVPDVHVFDFLKEGIAKHSLNVIFDALSSTTKAIKSGNVAEIKGLSPQSNYYGYASNAITTLGYSRNNIDISLQKVIIDPQSIQLNENSIEVDTTNYTSYDGGSISAGNATYVIQQIPGKSDWWITGGYTSNKNVTDETGEFSKSS